MSHSQINGKRFFNNILNAVGAGVVIALLPNALLGELLKFFKEGNHVLETIFSASNNHTIFYGFYYRGSCCAPI